MSMRELRNKNSTRDGHTEVGKFFSSTVEGDLGGERGCLMFSIFQCLLCLHFATCCPWWCGRFWSIRPLCITWFNQ